MYTPRVHRCCLIMLGLMLGLVFAHADTSSRVVVTFNTVAQREAAPVPPNTTLVKAYGRRLVLSFDRPFDEPFDVPWLTAELNASGVEEDGRIAPEQLGAFFSSIFGAGNASVEAAQGNASVEAAQSNASVEAAQGTTQNTSSDRLQWNLADSEPYSIHPETVWTQTRGTPTQVVAVLDGGLPSASLALFENVLPGYDFISDPEMSLDSDGRDPDWYDPGDAAPDCPTPSWHGLQVTSVLAANGPDGFQGVSPGISVLPVRVLGRCKTGYASDVADALVWAAGGQINGLPPNPSPAAIVGMSFTGAGPCPSYLQSAVTQAVNTGTILIAAAGNSAGDSTLFYPGNCQGVVAVTASTRQGTLAAYANTGLNVALGAPGGDSGDPILALSLTENATAIQVVGATGTSFSVPHVVGVLALGRAMNLSINSRSPQALTEDYEATTEQNCAVTQKCGTGILDAKQLIAWVPPEDSTDVNVSSYPVSFSGNYQVTGAATSCSAGQYLSLSTCSPCADGQYSLAGASACTQCPSNSVPNSIASFCKANAGFISPTILYPFLTGLGNTGSGGATTTVVGPPVIQTDACDTANNCRAAAYFSNTVTATPAQYLTVPNTYNSPMTIMLWARMDTGYPGGCTVSLDDGTSAIGTAPTNMGFVITEGPGVQYMYARLGTWQPAGSTYNPAANTWHHIAYTINDKTVTSYYNGGSAGSTTGTAALPGYLKLLVGTCNNNPGISYGFKGHISDVRMYQTVLSSTQIKSVYDSGSSATPYMACEAGSSSTAGTIACTQCTAGQFSTGSGLSSCALCTPGKYSTGIGMTTDTCVTCSSWAPTSCSDPTPNRHCSTAGVGKGVCCGAGTYFIDSVSPGTTCLNCPAGTYAVDGSGTACTQCPGGDLVRGQWGQCQQHLHPMFSGDLLHRRRGHRQRHLPDLRRWAELQRGGDRVRQLQCSSGAVLCIRIQHRDPLSCGFNHSDVRANRLLGLRNG